MPNERRDALFEAALALTPPEREAYLQQACAEDHALREEIGSLLAAHDASDGFFESLARESTQALHASLGVLASGRDDNPLAIGDTVAHYRVDAKLGRGGMGVVYRATDLRLDRPVALKVLPLSRATDAQAGERLLDEARAAAALDHPHIGTILDVGTVGGGLASDRMYMAMTFYEGETLADRLASGPVPVSDALRIGRQLASALAAAHDRGVVHRDVKPSNVLLTSSGDVRLVDFGIAARIGTLLPHTISTRGTRRYMSPERAGGAPPDPRADVWSLGLVLRDLLDARPGAATTPLPDALADLLHRCLDPDPSRRPMHAGAVLAELEAADRPRITAPPPVRRRTGTVIGLVSAGVVVALLAWQYRVRDRVDLASPGRTPVEVEGNNRVLVLPFENRSADTALASFAVLAADFVTEAIAATAFAEAVPATTALAIARDGSSAPPGIDPLVHLAQPVRAAWVISGTYEVQSDSVRVRAALSSGRDGRVVRTLRSVASLRSAPGEALAALARAAVVAIALELDPRVQADAMVPAIPPKWEAYEAYARGKEHFLAQRYREAIEEFGAAYARDSSFRFPLFYQGIAYANTGNWARLDTVVQTYRRRETAVSTPMERMSLRILGAILEGDIPSIYRAHREAESSGMIGPGGLGHFTLGASAFDIGRPRETIEILRQSDPARGELKGWPHYFDLLARAHLWIGAHDAALAVARHLQITYPELDMGPERAMELFAADGALASVDSVLESALRSSPDPGALLRFAGGVLRLGGHEAAAQRHFSRAVAYDREALRRAKEPATLEQRAALGESLLLANALDEAEATFRALHTERPDLMDPPTALGRIAARRGDTTAVTGIDRLLSQRAAQQWNRGTATYRRARLAAVQGNGERAAQLLEQAWREGYSIYYSIWTDPEFVRVRAHPAMRALLTPKG